MNKIKIGPWFYNGEQLAYDNLLITEAGMNSNKITWRLIGGILNS